MKYKLLGKTGLRVSEVCLGTMTFGTEFHWGSTKDQSRKVFNAFVEAGGNFLDTANYYTKGTSETMLGEFIAKKRESYVIATKYTLSTNPKDPNASGNHRKNLMQALEASLKRMKTEYIDLYWVHAWDFFTPIEEIMRALDDMVRAGKILYIGVSNFPSWMVSQANTLAESKGWTSFTALQMQYSLIERNIEREFTQLADDFKLTLTAWSPLGMGVLTGKYLKKGSKESRFEVNPEWGKKFLTKKNQEIVEAVVAIAKELGRTPAQVALRWVCQRGKNIIPIVGAKTADQLKDTLGAIEFELNEKQMKRLNDASAIAYGYPYDFLAEENIRKLLHGESEII